MLSIAIDGPSGAGKSTVAKAVAKHLGILYLDTGAMYRALGLLALESGVSPADAQGVHKLLESADVRVELQGGAQRTFLGGRDVTELLRTQEVAKAASDISVLSEVRIYMVSRQQQIASEVDIVMDGRDIGTFVLPGADFKFFITATPQERAHRRFLELRAAGGLNKTAGDIELEIRSRDATDMGRAFAPLTLAHDACVIDTTQMAIDEVVQMVLNIINEQKR